MEKKWIKDLGENECIHAPTQEIADKICKKFYELGMCWCNGESYLNNTNYNVNKENTHYYPYDGCYSDKNYTIECYSKVYTINDLLDFEGERHNNTDEGYTKEEIELLDRFAGLAMQGICVNAGRNEHRIGKPEKISMDSYSIAKAMLRARKEALKNG